MKQILILTLIIGTFLAACAPSTPPTPTPDINATISSMSSTSVAATLTAQPTNTPLPTETPLPTNTPEPIVTDTPTPTDTPIPTQTLTPQAFVGCFTPNGTTNLSAPFKLENFTKVTVSVYINGTTTEGDHTVSCSYDVEPGGSTIFTIWFGNYSYWVVGKKTYSGTFWINDSDKSTMQITDKGIKIGPFAYKNQMVI